MSGCSNIDFNINCKQVMKFTSNLKKVEVFRLAPTPAIQVHLLCDKVGMGQYKQKLDFVIFLHREL